MEEAEMANWKQTTEVVGVKTYPERVIDSDELLEMMAQMHFEKQAGADFTLKAAHDENFETTAYIFVRKMKDRTVINRFEKI